MSAEVNTSASARGYICAPLFVLTPVHLFLWMVSTIRRIILAVFFIYMLIKDNSMGFTIKMNENNSVQIDIMRNNETGKTDTDIEITKAPELQSNLPGIEKLRLSGDITAKNYDLRVKIPLFGGTFEANLTMQFAAKRSTKSMELNALGLRFPEEPRQIRISKISETILSEVNVTRITVNETLQKVFFELDQELNFSQEYNIYIPYSGPINDEENVGLFSTSYLNNDGKKLYVIGTHMEPINARRMVPCLDEPAFKAIWKLTVVHPKNLWALSNTYQTMTEEDEDWRVTTFEPTPLMSSYLLALVVSEFKCINSYAGYSDSIKLQICARDDKLKLASYALHAARNAFNFYQDYFEIAYSLNKLDIIAIPEFHTIGMENWGLIFCREQNILYDPNLDKLDKKLKIAEIIAHEIAHQWLGNLVTLEWWSEIWLNEGFTELLSYDGMKAILGNQFSRDEYFILNSLHVAFERDVYPTSRPLKAKTLDYVKELFFSNTYDKGAALLWMIRAMLGEQSYKNVNSKNLWDVFNEVEPDIDFNEFTHSWTNQQGYPLVDVTINDVGQLLISQRLFMFHQNDAKENETDFKHYNWTIPIWYNVVNGTSGKQRMLLTNKSQMIYETYGRNDWLVVVNDDSDGLYRVNYDTNLLDRITQQLLDNHTVISKKSRTRIIDDAFKLAATGRLAYTAALNLTRYLNGEKNILPWEMALNGFYQLNVYFEDSDYYRLYLLQLMNRFGDFFKKEFNEIFNNENLEIHELLFGIFYKMCMLKDTRCIDWNLEIFRTNFWEPCMSENPQNRICSKCSKVPSLIRQLTYCSGIRYGTEKEFDQMKKLLIIETDIDERRRLIAALTCSPDIDSLKKLIVIALDLNSTIIRRNEKFFFFLHMSVQTFGRTVLYNYFLDNWPQIYEILKNDKNLLSAVIFFSIQNKSSRVIGEVEQFLKKNAETTQKYYAFKLRLEVLKRRQKWIEKNFKTLNDWFKAHGNVALIHGEPIIS